MATKVKAKAKKAAPKTAKSTAKPKRPKAAKSASASRGRSSGGGKPEKTNAADALIALIESPLVADLLAAAVTAAAATVISHKLKKDRAEGSLVRAVGAATAAAVGKQLAVELQEMRDAKRGK